MPFGHQMFMDSGAYSAWSKSESINIDAYIDFCREFGWGFDVFATLDVIGDHEATIKNTEYIRSKGIPVIPVYHLGEPIEILQFYVHEGYDYIGIGGAAHLGGSEDVRAQFFDSCFEQICDAEGRPQLKVHGFGMTSLNLMARYPWHTVDSTSWLLHSAGGAILFHSGEAGTINKCFISGYYTPDRREHLLSFPTHDREVIRELIHSKGYDFNELAQDHQARNLWNINFFLELERRINENPPRFSKPQQDIFGAATSCIPDAEGFDPGFLIYFAGSGKLKGGLTDAVLESPARARLFSFYYVGMDKAPDRSQMDIWLSAVREVRDGIPT